MRRLPAAALAAMTAVTALSAPPAAAQQALVDVPILYLERQVARPPVLSNLDPHPGDEALAGARLGLTDNESTGRFLGHGYTLEEVVVAIGDDWLSAARAALAERPLAVVHAPMADLLALADSPEAEGALIFNASAPDDALRDDACRANLLHAAPSRAMLTDALAQVLVKKRWTDWGLIEGRLEGDAEYADALRRSAAKFGARIRAEKVWAFDADMRRSAAAEVPLFTQDMDVDVLLIADEQEDFGRYVLYNTWDPRPVAGTEGLTPRAWSPVVEQWGAAQLQGRFEDLAGRQMLAGDYGAWVAVRAIGEAVTRTGAADVATLRDYLLSEDFELAGFKGRVMTFRSWNGQLRQPIPLVHPRALVASAPVEGFLHQRTELDTLGLDEPESACTAFQ